MGLNDNKSEFAYSGGFIIDQLLKILFWDDFGTIWKFLFDKVLCGITFV